jgi:acetyltransferase-like isoleucine patch superfamily enzyme
MKLAAVKLINMLMLPVLRGRMKECVIGPDVRVNLLRVRNAKGASLVIGHGSLCRATIIFEKPDAKVNIGENTFIGKSAFIVASGIDVGSDVLISWDVTIVDHDSHALAFAHRATDVAGWREGRKDWSHVRQKPVRIADKAWIGFGAAILKGVTIGEGAIVAAKSVVTRDVAPWTVVGGNPARELRKLSAND